MKSIFTIFLALATLQSIVAADDDLAEKIRIQNRNVVKAAAESLAGELPKRVDAHTRLVAIDPKGETLLYTFEIDAGPKSDERVISEGKERMGRNVTAGICATSRRFLESGITIAYRYLSAATGRELFRFDVDEKRCGYSR